MTWQEVFLSDRQLRPIWRCLLSIVLIFAAFLLVAVVIGLIAHFLEGPTRLFVSITGSGMLMFMALLGVFKFMADVFDWRPLGSVGVAFHPRWRAELGVGLIVGTTMILTVVGGEWLMGMARFSLSAASPAQVAGSGLLLCLALLVAAANEELIFRGYPFQRLLDSIGPVGAISVFSILFGLGHLMNPQPTVISTLNTMLVGVTLAVAYLRTRALWLPIGIHLSWNFVQGYALGLPVSGVSLPSQVLAAEVSGPQWVTGGAYGPEGGLLTTVIILVTTVYLMSSRRIYVTGEMAKLLSGPAAGDASETAATILSLAGSARRDKDDAYPC